MQLQLLDNLEKLAIQTDDTLKDLLASDAPVEVGTVFVIVKYPNYNDYTYAIWTVKGWIVFSCSYVTGKIIPTLSGILGELIDISELSTVLRTGINEDALNDILLNVGFDSSAILAQK